MLALVVWSLALNEKGFDAYVLVGRSSANRVIRHAHALAEAAMNRQTPLLQERSAQCTCTLQPAIVADFAYTCLHVRMYVHSLTHSLTQRTRLVHRICNHELYIYHVNERASKHAEYCIVVLRVSARPTCNYSWRVVGLRTVLGHACVWRSGVFA